MGEAKRRAQVAAASITDEHRCIASRIDERMMMLDAAGLDEVEIIAAMVEYMSDFHRLITEMTGPAMNALCSEFAGLNRYAKIVETIASGIASGQIKVPGGRAHSEERRIAAAIDQRVRQLEAKGVSDEALPEHMVGYMLDLQRLWSTTSDELLASLCRAYPGLYRYGMVVEAAFEAEKKKAATQYCHPPELPDSLKATVARLLTDGATLERGFQAVLDARPERDLWVEAELLEETRKNWTSAAGRAACATASRCGARGVARDDEGHF
jgi:hypothetical protein